MPRHLISDTHEWINEIPTHMTLYYYEYFNEGVACIIRSWDIIYR